MFLHEGADRATQAWAGGSHLSDRGGRRVEHDGGTSGDKGPDGASQSKASGRVDEGGPEAAAHEHGGGHRERVEAICVYALAAADVGRTEGETLGVALYKGISLWMMDRMETNSWAGSNDGLALSSSSSGISAFRAVTPGPRFPTGFSPVPSAALLRFNPILFLPGFQLSTRPGVVQFRLYKALSMMMMATSTLRREPRWMARPASRPSLDHLLDLCCRPRQLRRHRCTHGDRGCHRAGHVTAGAEVGRQDMTFLTCVAGLCPGTLAGGRRWTAVAMDG